ncbi:MAG: AraC family transcriptional regulator [Polyangiaceae bacterium]|nr:AraC family transcriptional regulator [Polyangiaceae bacterium]
MNSANAAPMDVLTDVLQTVRVSSVCYGRVELGAPWGVRVPESDSASFHVLLRGNAWLEVEGMNDPVALASGDLFALPHGRAHTLRDSVDTPARPLEEIVGGGDACSTGTIKVGGNGAAATLVCGAFRFEDRTHNPLLNVLPPLILIKGEDGRAVHWLEPTLQFMACEAASTRPGARTVVSRLADILFIQIVRGFLSSTPESQRGWLRALTEPQIGASLGLIHQDPRTPWTVAMLASRVGMSRSTFAGRFAELVGEPPLHYVTRWRMQRAAALLRDGRATLADIADRVGYESEAAFSKAFKRWVGAAPGAYRRASRDNGGFAEHAPH